MTKREELIEEIKVFLNNCEKEFSFEFGKKTKNLRIVFKNEKVTSSLNIVPLEKRNNILLFQLHIEEFAWKLFLTGKELTILAQYIHQFIQLKLNDWNTNQYFITAKKSLSEQFKNKYELTDTLLEIDTLNGIFKKFVCSKNIELLNEEQLAGILKLKKENFSLLNGELVEDEKIHFVDFNEKNALEKYENKISLKHWLEKQNQVQGNIFFLRLENNLTVDYIMLMEQYGKLTFQYKNIMVRLTIDNQDNLIVHNLGVAKMQYYTDSLMTSDEQYKIENYSEEMLENILEKWSQEVLIEEALVGPQYTVLYSVLGYEFDYQDVIITNNFVENLKRLNINSPLECNRFMMKIVREKILLKKFTIQRIGNHNLASYFIVELDNEYYYIGVVNKAVNIRYPFIKKFNNDNEWVNQLLS